MYLKIRLTEQRTDTYSPTLAILPTPQPYLLLRHDHMNGKPHTVAAIILFPTRIKTKPGVAFWFPWKGLRWHVPYAHSLMCNETLDNASRKAGLLTAHDVFSGNVVKWYRTVVIPGNKAETHTYIESQKVVLQVIEAPFFLE